MGDNQATIEKIRDSVDSGDFGGLAKAVLENATDDFVEEWPQSGERLDRNAFQKMNEGYADATGSQPKFKFRRLIGGGDVYTVEGTIDYGDGVPVSYVGVIEMRDGKFTRTTSYFANPFEAPAWRAGFVQRMDEPAPA
jgi:hypothetical protein